MDKVGVEREILFRGKRKDNGAWVEGDLRQDNDLGKKYISGWDYYTNEDGWQREPFEHEVKPESVCQYTGLTDSTKWEQLSEDEKGGFLFGRNYKKGCMNTKEDWNGRKIFEKDIISFVHKKCIEEDGEDILPDFPPSSSLKKHIRNYAVEFINTFCNYGLRARNKSIHFLIKQSTICMHDSKVIGNIFENPVLLDENREDGE